MFIDSELNWATVLVRFDSALHKEFLIHTTGS